jgi:uncharacterized membrane protein YbhN (UPF0104 family)
MAPSVRGSPAPDALHPRHLRHRVAQLLVVVVAVGVVVAALPGLGGVRQHLGQVQPGWLIIILAAELASALSYVVVLRGVFCPCMGWGPSYALGMSELAADSLLPAGGAGGLALGAWALHRGGMASNQIAGRTVTFFLVTSAANFAAVIVAGVGVALGLLPGSAALTLAAVPAALGAATVGLVLLAPRFLDRVTPAPASASPGDLSTRARGFAVTASVTTAGGVRDAMSLLRSGRPSVVLGSLGYMAFDMAVLAACFRTTGSLPPLGDFVLAYTIGQLGGLLPLPGGIGATDSGLIGTFVLYGASLGPVTAAVLIYRVVQLGLPAVLGAPAFVMLQRTLRGPEGFARVCAPLAEGEPPAASGPKAPPGAPAAPRLDVVAS